MNDHNEKPTPEATTALRRLLDDLFTATIAVVLFSPLGRRRHARR